MTSVRLLPRVALHEISKAFAGAPALRGVDFDVLPGEIHALCGENGAGKSTLMNVLGGVIRPDHGKIEIDGRDVIFRGPADALEQGVAVIHQELSLVPCLTVAENLYLGHEPRLGPWIRRNVMFRKADAILERLGFKVSSRAKVANLPIGTRQLVEIAKALSWAAKVLVLDEPTAALSRAEVERLFEALADLKKQHIAIVYISHHLDEVNEIADRVTVLRDGRRVGTWLARDLGTDRLIQQMLGQEVAIAEKSMRPQEESSICWRVTEARTDTLNGVDLSVRTGEIVGLTGLAGAGHEQLASCAFGSEHLTSGRMGLLGEPYQPNHPRHAITRGVASVPGDRRRSGLIPTLDIADNLTLSILDQAQRRFFLDRTAMRTLAKRWCDTFEVARKSLTQGILTLSGGNQQKVLMARWVATSPKFLILNDPTRGIDVKTRESIHQRVEALAEAGLGVLLVTSDTQELVRLADRVVVLREGRVAAELGRLGISEETIVAAMIGAGA